MLDHYFVFFKTVDSKPTRQQINDLVMKTAAKYWKDIGVQLLKNEDCPKLDTIGLNFPTNNAKCCEQMFILWLDNDKQATWKKLLDALKAVDLITLADDIEKSMYVYMQNILLANYQ